MRSVVNAATSPLIWHNEIDGKKYNALSAAQKVMSMTYFPTASVLFARMLVLFDDCIHGFGFDMDDLIGVYDRSPNPRPFYENSLFSLLSKSDYATKPILREHTVREIRDTFLIEDVKHTSDLIRLSREHKPLVLHDLLRWEIDSYLMDSRTNLQMQAPWLDLEPYEPIADSFLDYDLIARFYNANALDQLLIMGVPARSIVEIVEIYAFGPIDAPEIDPEDEEEEEQKNRRQP